RSSAPPRAEGARAELTPRRPDAMCRDDRPQGVVPVAPLARARPRAMPCVRRGRVSARVTPRARARRGPAGVSLRPGARPRRGRRAPSLARPRRPDAAAVARARGGRVLRDVLLRLRDPLRPGPLALRPRRQDADASRAGALRVLEPLGAGAAA